MTSALKIVPEEIKDSEEFEIPQINIKEAQNLKSQKQLVDQEIETVRLEKVRKENESTKTFQLRELELTEKVKNLEQKKAQIEKDLHHILHQKNSKLHEHLIKVTEVLVLEAKKIQPIEKEIETGVSKIYHLKNEMQELIEGNINDRKKNAEIIENQVREVRNFNILLRDTTNLLTQDYQQLTKELEQIHRQKLELLDQLGDIKDKIISQSTILKTLEDKKEQLSRLERSLENFTDKTSELDDIQRQIENKREELAKLRAEKEDVQKIISKAQIQRNELSSNISHLESSYQDLIREVGHKKQELINLDKSYLETKVRVENVRKEEFDVLKTLKIQQSQLAEILREAAVLQASKNEAIKMQEESLAFLNEKRDFYRREMELMEDHQRNLGAKLEAEFQTRRLELEKDFEIFKETRERELKKELDEVRHVDQERFRKKRKALTSDILEVFKKQDRHQGFASQEEKTQAIRKDLSDLFDKYFGRHKRWKLW